MPSGLIDALLWGVVNGCIYILLATGLNLIFGVMKLVNFAHGQLLMVGAFVAYETTTILGLNAYASIVVSMAAVAVIGIFVERLAFRRVRGTDKLNEIFVSLGLIYIFENAATLVWDKNLYSIRIPSPYESLGISIGDANVGYDKILAIGIVAAILVGLILLTKKTKFGLAMRATSQKSDAAMLMGINTKRVYTYTFAIGAALAGAAGAIYGILINFSPVVGAIPTIKAFVIIILGGLGSIPGAIVGGLALGFSEQLAVFFLGSIWQDAVAFAVLIIVLVIRPTGLFGEKGE